MAKRVEKKSETIEVRVSYSEKLAFMEACKKAGTTASHAIRGYIDDFLHPKPEDALRDRILRSLPIIGAAAAIAITIFLLPSTSLSSRDANFTHSGPTSERVIRFYDQNGDGVLTNEDATTSDAANADAINWLIEIGDKDGNGRLVAEEFEGLANFTIEVNGKRGSADRSASNKDENIVIMKPGMSEEERQAFIDQSGLADHMTAGDFKRLTRMLDALTADDIEPAKTNLE